MMKFSLKFPRSFGKFSDVSFLACISLMFIVSEQCIT